MPIPQYLHLPKLEDGNNDSYPRLIAGSFSGSLRFNFIDTEGRIISNTWFSYASPFRKGVALVRKKFSIARMLEKVSDLAAYYPQRIDWFRSKPFLLRWAYEMYGLFVRWISYMILLTAMFIIFFWAGSWLYYKFWFEYYSPLLSLVSGTWMISMALLFSYLWSERWSVIDENAKTLQEWKKYSISNEKNIEEECKQIRNREYESKHLVSNIKYRPTEENAKYQIIPRKKDEIADYFSKAVIELSMHIYKISFTLICITDEYVEEMSKLFSSADAWKYCLKSYYPTARKIYLFDTKDEAIGFMIEYVEQESKK